MIRSVSFNEDDIKETQVEDAQAITSLEKKNRVTWYDIEGFKDIPTVQHFGTLAKLHRLLLEDIVSYQRPKLFHDEKHAVLILQSSTSQDEFEQIAVVVGAGFVLTFQEGLPGDCFDPLRQRLREKIGLVRTRNSDYLAYTLIDAVVDSYFPFMDRINERVEELEADVLSLRKAGPQIVETTRSLRHILGQTQRNLRPLFDCLSSIIRDSSVFGEEARLYLSDTRDHVLQLLDSVEGQRETVTQLTDLYLSSLSHRMNQSMAVLTLIATIFMPLSFLAGIYGMNFDPNVSPYNMPELHWRYGYPFALGLMVLLASGMVVFFRRRGWFSM